MCGITGFINFSRSEGSFFTLQKMKGMQKHRGPDDSGCVAASFTGDSIITIDDSKSKNSFRNENIWLGFNRLSIQDTSYAGHQPMLSNDAKIAFTLNGEIYNANEFRDYLRTKGYQFKSNTDTEVAFYLYLEFGLYGMLSRLNGMFAIVIVDLQKRRVFLARDRFGIKPLYILEQDHRISFSSEIKSFKALPDFSFSLQEEELHEFLLFRNVINRTLFKNIRNLNPGTFIEISPEKTLTENTYYDINKESSILKYSGLNAKQKLEEMLMQSVSRQMISDVKLGCQLSGGIDSSIVTYYAQQALEKGKLETVSIIFDDERYSEYPYVKQVTEQLSLQAHCFNLSRDYYLDCVDKATWHFEQPLNHPNTIGIYLLSQEAKNHVTVLLSGEGADELLAGYRRFVNQTLTPWRLKSLIYNLYRSNCNATLLKKTLLDSDNRMILSSAFGSPILAGRLFKDFELGKALSQRKKILGAVKSLGVRKHRIYEMQTYLPDLLMRQDKMSMAHSIENRVPFLDNKMVSLALSIDDKELIGIYKGKLQGKKILKELCADKFSYDFAYRKKMGFSIPLSDFLQSSRFTDRWYSEILPGIKQRGIFNYSYAKKALNKGISLKGSDFEKIWLLFGFEIWAQKYLD